MPHLAYEPEILCLAYDPIKKVIATGGNDRVIKVRREGEVQGGGGGGRRSPSTKAARRDHLGNPIKPLRPYLYSNAAALCMCLI